MNRVMDGIFLMLCVLFMLAVGGNFIVAGLDIAEAGEVVKGVAGAALGLCQIVCGLAVAYSAVMEVEQ